MRNKKRKGGFIITDSIVAVSILFLAMYLFSTFNNNTNFILNDKKSYKKLVYNAEIELNSELDNIKNGKINENYKNNNEFNGDDKVKECKFDEKYKSNINNLEKININKKVELIDEKRGIYMVTVVASKDDRQVKLQGYEQLKEDEMIVQN